MMYSHENFSRGKLLPKLYYLSNILSDQDSRILISRIRISRSLSAQKADNCKSLSKGLFIRVGWENLIIYNLTVLLHV